MELARTLILRLATLLEGASDVDTRWPELLDENDLHYAELLFEHVMRAHAARWTTLTDAEHRRVAALHQRLFHRIIARPPP